MPYSDLSARNVADVSVTYYGADPTGVNDSTVAIQKAVDDLYNNMRRTEQYTVYAATIPTLFFPSGIYKIKKQITFGPDAIRVMGDNSIIKRNTDPGVGFEGDFGFLFNWTYDVRIQDLTFKGFAKALRMENGNLESAQTLIQECAFIDNGLAVEFSTGSTIHTIESTKFYYNTKAINMVGGDQLHIKDCWIAAGSMGGLTPGPGLRPAQIDNYGSYLLMDSTMLIPGPREGGTREAAWINNYGSVTITGTRQGGEYAGGYCLVNNYTGGDPIVSGSNPTAVIVKDCQCYGLNLEDNTGNYSQPTIVRFVDAIPNMTVIRNNRGIVDARIMDFSIYKRNQVNPATGVNYTIQDILEASRRTVGMVTASLDQHTFLVEVANNVGGITQPHGSHVPLELFPFVRDEESLWPYKRPDNRLPVLNHTTVGGINFPGELDGSDIVYKFRYDAGFNTALLVNYSGCPLPQGSVNYRGGFTGLLKANGFWSDPVVGNIGEVRQSLVLEPLLNQIGDPNPGSFPTGLFTVTAYWEDSGTPRSSDVDNDNRIFCIRISGRSGPIEYGLDQIRVIAVDAL